MQPLTISRHGKHFSGLHSSCYMSACKLPTTHYCLSQIWAALSLPTDDKALSWSWCDAVMLFHAFIFFVPGSMVWNGCLFIYFQIRVKRCISKWRSVVGVLLKPKSCSYWLSLIPVAVPSHFRVAGHIAKAWICLSTDPETSGSVVVSAPQLF